MAYITHHVKEFDHWKEIFDKDEIIRQSIGARLVGLFRGMEDPNEISILFELDDLDTMMEMMESEDMKMKMIESGVDSEPTLQIMNLVETHMIEHV